MKKSLIKTVEIVEISNESFTVYVEYNSGRVRAFNDITKSVLDFIIGNLNSVTVIDDCGEYVETRTYFYADVESLETKLLTLVKIGLDVVTRTIYVSGKHLDMHNHLFVEPMEYIPNKYYILFYYMGKTNNIGLKCSYSTRYSARKDIDNMYKMYA